MDPADDFYVRQLRDWKISLDLELIRPAGLAVHATACGWTLARAHSRSGDDRCRRYLARSDRFDRALAEFAAAYADINELDHRGARPRSRRRSSDCGGERLGPAVDVLDARRVRLEIHHVWIDEVAVFLFEGNQQAQPAFGPMTPFASANITSSARVSSCSLRMMYARCVSTVRTEMKSFLAISWLV
jgi:Uncharacterized protein conserved in bacteria (DUF2252)